MNATILKAQSTADGATYTDVYVLGQRVGFVQMYLAGDAWIAVKAGGGKVLDANGSARFDTKDEAVAALEALHPVKITNVSRDWRGHELIEFASIGFDYESAKWVVTQGRTASGREMVRTDEPMIVVSHAVFDDDRAASEFARELGYR